jgi:coproporphyrinogen III oxidase-like Fe-S oxidoreductase
VANYACPGHESRHNTVYWTGGAYVGVGPSAASMLPAELAARLEPASVWASLLAKTAPADRVRFTVNETLSDFVHGSWDRTPAEIEVLTVDEAAREDVMLGLRLSRGVADADVTSAGLAHVLERLAASGLTECAAGRWRTTERGWLLGNEVFGAVWAGE